jgi:hypothetical protein
MVVGPMTTVPLRGRQDGGIYFYKWKKVKSSHAEILTRKCWHQQQSRNCVMSGTALSFCFCHARAVSWLGSLFYFFPILDMVHPWQCGAGNRRPKFCNLDIPKKRSALE